MDGIQLRISDLIYAVRKRWKLITVLTIAGLIIGILMSGVSYLQGTMSKNYDIEASAVVLAQDSSGNFPDGGKNSNKNDFQLSKDMTETVIFILKSDKAIEKVIENTKLIGITTKDISTNLKVSQHTDSPVITFSLTWRSADEGVNILKELLDTSNSVLEKTLKTGRLSVINEPAATYIVGGGMNVPIWGTMLVFGLVAGIGIVVLDMLIRPTLINVKDAPSEFGIETLGIIPEDNEYFKQEEPMLSAERNSSSIIKQSYSAAAYIIKNRLGSKKTHHIFYVTSTRRGEGKTSAAANLAIQLADMENKVLLVDFDTQNPNLGPLFIKNIDYEYTLNSLYRGDINEAEAVTFLTGYLDILPVVLEHNPIPVDSTVLDLIQNLSKSYDYVIIDAAPVGEVSDTLSLNQIADTAVLVVGFDMATKNEIKETVDKLDKSGIRILGCIINKEDAVESVSIVGRDTEKKKKMIKAKKQRSGKNTFEEIKEMTKREQKENQTESKQKEEKDSDDKVPDNNENNEDNKIQVQQKKIKRNTLEDISTIKKESNSLSDDEAMNALLEIGLNGEGKND